MTQLMQGWGELVARYGVGLVLLGIVAVVFTTAAVLMLVGGVIALQACRREDEAGPHPRRVS